MCYDNRQPLRNGYSFDIIEDQSNNKYRLTVYEEIGRGGSCITYRGSVINYVDPKGLPVDAIIKEFYPRNLEEKVLCRKSEVLNADTPDLKRSFDNQLTVFRKGQVKHIIFASSNPDKALPAVDHSGFANGTFYTVSKVAKGTTLEDAYKTNQVKTIVDALKIAASICDVIFAIHNNKTHSKNIYDKGVGQLYLDLKPSNVYYSDGNAFLFDFDSVCSFVNIEYCSRSEGWAAPEQEFNKAKTGYKDIDKIGYHTDIYAIGAILFWLLTGKSLYDMSLDEIPENFDWKSQIVLKDTTSVTSDVDYIEELDRIMREMTCHDADERAVIFGDKGAAKTAREKINHLIKLTEVNNANSIVTILFGSKKRTAAIISALLVITIILGIVSSLSHKVLDNILSPKDDTTYSVIPLSEQAPLDSSGAENQHDNILTSPDTLKFVSAKSDNEYFNYNDWGDSLGGREIYTTKDINNDILKNQSVFNSVSDSKVGDERKFVGAKNAEIAKDEWTNDYIEVADGESYYICLYVHNDNPHGLDAIAEGTNVTFSLPTTVSTSHTVVGYLDSSNTSPNRCWDTVNFRSNDLFYLEYVKGSAKYTNNFMDTISLGDDTIHENGHPLGYDRFDGKIPGGDNYAGVVTIEVRIHKSVSAGLKLYGRIEGTKAWLDDKLDANIGDTVEYKIEYVNLLNETTNNVMIRDILPTNTEYIKDSTFLYNSGHQDGVLISNNITTSGVNIGDYDSQGNAYIIFKTRVVDNTLADGKNQLVNWANVTLHHTSEPTVYKDDFSIMIDK